MCDLNDDFEDLEMNFTQSEIKMLGWDDKEWIVEGVTFILFICGIIYLYCS
jgi:hypothetical protein